MRLAAKAAGVFRVNDLALDQIDPDGLKYVATVSVRAHWFIVALMLFELVYRPYYGVAKYAAYGLLLGMLIGLNGYIHHRLHANRPVTWRWVSALFALDVFLLSAVLTISNGFSHYFFHLFYYGALAGSAVIFTSFRLNMAWVTITSAVYAAISLSVGDGIDIEAREEKALLARIAVMFAVVLAVNLASRFERLRWRQSMDRERELHRERVELSRTIHDTVAQTAYMVGLGVERARKLGGESNKELAATLDATAELQKSAIWELRRPLDGGQVYEGTSLRGILKSHASTFTTITSVPAEVTVHGVEPELPTEVRSRLFSIAHNALTNAFRHARAGRVEVELDFGADSVRLSVSDDGAGLPDDYARRGHGFAGMREDADAVGGNLIVETVGRHGSTTVTCTVPLRTE
jgi:signal transduction histidine kinase